MLNQHTNYYRSYTITSKEDEWNIENGRCPTYALDWGSFNQKHWPKNHDYINGYNNAPKREEYGKFISISEPSLTIKKKHIIL
jgi:hypothetical protein